MNRAQLLKYFHEKVIAENLPENPIDMTAGPDEYGFLPEAHTVSGPFVGPSEDWDSSKFVERKIRDDYYVYENLDVLNLAPDLIPEIVVWGIGEWWQWKLTIPVNATKPEDCSGVGSSGE